MYFIRIRTTVGVGMDDSPSGEDVDPSCWHLSKTVIRLRSKESVVSVGYYKQELLRTLMYSPNLTGVQLKIKVIIIFTTSVYQMFFHIKCFFKFVDMIGLLSLV